MNHHTHAGHPGFAPTQALQHQRSAGLIHPHQQQSQQQLQQQQHQHPHHLQQPSQHPQPLQHSHRSNSPHRSRSLQGPQDPYISPHSSTHSLSQQHPSPYIGSVPGLPAHHSNEASFFAHNPSPFSTNSTSGSYASNDANDNMAAQATLPRQAFPPLASFHTPQPNSPASIHSPQVDAHGRPLYAVPTLPQQMYYPPYSQMQQSPYGQQPSPVHHPAMGQAPAMLMSHHPSQPQPHLPSQQHHQQSQPQQHQAQSQPSQQSPHGHSQGGMVDSKPSLASMPRSSSIVSQTQGTPQPSSGSGIQQSFAANSAPSNPNAAPGPIPATTPLVVRQDQNGVQWIAFEYSRDRVKMEYTIRCDVESVNVEELAQDFKSANCVYPRACGGRDQYKGNRLHYESECNAVGWALAELNPSLREKRGLIQRAVDSWRNSNSDVKLRSRRVRRMAKMHNRNATNKTPSGTPSPYANAHPATLHQPPLLPPGSARMPNMGPGHPHMHHVHAEGSEATGGGDVSANTSMLQTSHLPTTTATNSTVRYAQNFYPTYPQPVPHSHNVAAPPPIHGVSMHDQRREVLAIATNMSNMVPASAHHAEDSVTGAAETPTEVHERNLFGDLPESKKRKFIVVDDPQRNTRTRVRVRLDSVRMDDMPDAHLRNNSVYPRSYFPRQMKSPENSPKGRGVWSGDTDSDAGHDGADGDDDDEPARTLVHVPVLDGTDVQLPIPRMTHGRRAREVALNELGYRMAWTQPRVFDGRMVFLQKSLDAYRLKMRDILTHEGKTLAPHFELRPGKKKWEDFNRRRMKRGASP